MFGQESSRSLVSSVTSLALSSTRSSTRSPSFPSFRSQLQKAKSSSLEESFRSYSQQDNSSAFFEAIENGNTTLIRLMATENPRLLAAFNDQNKTPIFIAAQKGSVEVIKILAALGADVNENINGFTPLFEAALSGHVEAIDALVELGANATYANDVLANAIFYAAQGGHVEAIIALANLGLSADNPQKNGVTPLYIAAEFGHANAIQALVSLGATPNQKTRAGITPIEMVTKKIEKATQNNDIAALKKYSEALMMLVSVGANPFVKGNLIQTPDQEFNEALRDHVLALGFDAHGKKIDIESLENRIGMIMGLIKRFTHASDRKSKAMMKSSYGGTFSFYGNTFKADELIQLFEAIKTILTDENQDDIIYVLTEISAGIDLNDKTKANSFFTYLFQNVPSPIFDGLLKASLAKEFEQTLGGATRLRGESVPSCLMKVSFANHTENLKNILNGLLVEGLREADGYYYRSHVENRLQLTRPGQVGMLACLKKLVNDLLKFIPSADASVASPETPFARLNRNAAILFNALSEAFPTVEPKTFAVDIGGEVFLRRIIGLLKIIGGTIPDEKQKAFVADLSTLLMFLSNMMNETDITQEISYRKHEGMRDDLLGIMQLFHVCDRSVLQTFLLNIAGQNHLAATIEASPQLGMSEEQFLLEWTNQQSRISAAKQLKEILENIPRAKLNEEGIALREIYVRDLTSAIELKVPHEDRLFNIDHVLNEYISKPEFTLFFLTLLGEESYLDKTNSVYKEIRAQLACVMELNIVDITKFTKPQLEAACLGILEMTDIHRQGFVLERILRKDPQDEISKLFDIFQATHSDVLALRSLLELDDHHPLPVTLTEKPQRRGTFSLTTDSLKPSEPARPRGASLSLFNKTARQTEALLVVPSRVSEIDAALFVNKSTILTLVGHTKDNSELIKHLEHRNALLTKRDSLNPKAISSSGAADIALGSSSQTAARLSEGSTTTPPKPPLQTVVDPTPPPGMAPKPPTNAAASHAAIEAPEPHHRSRLGL